MKTLILVLFLALFTGSLVADELLLGAYYAPSSSTRIVEGHNTPPKKETKIACFVKNIGSTSVRIALNKKILLGPYFSDGRISAINVLLRLERPIDSFLGSVVASESVSEWWNLKPGEVALLFEGVIPVEDPTLLAHKIAISMSFDPDYARQIGSFSKALESIAVEPGELINILGVSKTADRDPFR